MKTINDLLNHEEYNSFMDSLLGNDLFINDPDRADRIHEAAELGCNGSMHCEIIQDWRDFLSTLDIDDEDREAVEQDIDDCEAWHEKNGSLYQQLS